MGLFDRIFKRAPTQAHPAQTMGGYWPTYGQYSADIYNSDVVQQALRCVVDEIKKLNPQHIRMVDNDPVPVSSTIQDVLRDPNPLMTTAEFLEKTTWLLLLNYNAFILPVYYTWTDKTTGQERRYYEALYPIKPSVVDFIEDAGGRLFVKFAFAGGESTTIPYDDVIHVRYNYSVGDYMGGGESGQPDNRGLNTTLQINRDLLQGVAKAMNASYSINGIIKYNTMLDDGKMSRALKEFEAKLKNSESGFLPLDLKAEYTPLEHKTQLVDDATLRFVDEKILRNWGVPLAILRGDYTQDVYNAFYQKTLEPIIITMSQALTKKLFTRRERAFGNKIELYPKDLIFMTPQQTLDLIEKLSPTGGLLENEKRTFLGLRPLPELAGKRYMSLNWIDANHAAEYQVGQPAEGSDGEEGSADE